LQGRRWTGGGWSEAGRAVRKKGRGTPPYTPRKGINKYQLRLSEPRYCWELLRPVAASLPPSLSRNMGQSPALESKSLTRVFEVIGSVALLMPLPLPLGVEQAEGMLGRGRTG